MIIDTREPARYQETIGNALTRAGEPVSHKLLETGDYAWDGVLVERKSVPDLVGSLRDGRWPEQVVRLVLFPGTAFLLLEGILVAPAGWDLNAIDNALLVAQLAGLAVVHSKPGPTGVAERLLSLLHLTRKGEHTSLLPRRPRVIETNPAATAAVGMLAALPGSGPKTARKLISEYGGALAALQSIQDGNITGIPAKRIQLWQQALEWHP